MVITCNTNALGYRQYYDEQGREICPLCNSPYVNEGKGSVCSPCADIHEQDLQDDLDSH